MAKKASSLVLRPPLAKVAGATVAHYTITALAATTTVAVDAAVPATATAPATTDAARWQLQPVFPGLLTFEPSDPTTVPAGTTPADWATVAIEGTLHLEISGPALAELRRRDPGLALPLHFAYLGVTLTHDFFEKLVNRALRSGDGTRDYKLAHLAPTATAPEKWQSYARGQYGIPLTPDLVRTPPFFPSLAPVPPATTTGEGHFALGVRAITKLALGTAGGWPATIREAVQRGATILAPPGFAPIALPWLYQVARRSVWWADAKVAADEAHPLFAAIDATEAGPPVPMVGAPTEWRRVRARPKDRVAEWATPRPQDGFTTLTLHANKTGAGLWNAGATVIGEVYVQRPNDETFDLSVTDAGGGVVKVTPLPAATGPGYPPLAPFAASVPLSWVPAAPLALTVREQSFVLDMTALPDAVTAGIGLGPGAFDEQGRTFDASGSQLANVELVASLRAMLRSLGFGTPPTTVKVPGREPRDVYDAPLTYAVREFQREARRGQALKGGALIAAPSTAGGHVPAGVTGTADADTIAAVGDWIAAGCTSIATFDARKTQSQHVELDRRRMVDWREPGFAASANPKIKVGGGMERPRWYAESRLAASTEDMGFYEANGRGVEYAGGGPVKIFSLFGAGLPGVPTDLWKQRVMTAASFIESECSFESLNTYDGVYLSYGLAHWTLGGAGDPGELPFVLGNNLPAADFARLLGVWQLGTVNSGAGTGFFTLDGAQVKTHAQKEEFRTLRWTRRFIDAARDQAMQIAQIRALSDRMDTVLGKNTTFAGTALTLRKALPSEFLRAVALAHHIQSPATVVTLFDRALEGVADHKVIALKAGESLPAGQKPWEETLANKGGITAPMFRALRDAWDAADKIPAPPGKKPPSIVGGALVMTQAQCDAFVTTVQYVQRASQFGGTDLDTLKQRWAKLESFAPGGASRKPSEYKALDTAPSAP